MSPDFPKLYGKLKLLGAIAGLGLLVLIFSLVHGPEDGLGQALIIFSALAILPAFLLTYCMTILHWKHRYIGKKSTLWGILLLLETSGWFKIVYLFRHILPDIQGTGRYRREMPIQSIQHNAGSRPSSNDLPASETPSAPAPRG